MNLSCLKSIEKPSDSNVLNINFGSMFKPSDLEITFWCKEIFLLFLVSDFLEVFISYDDDSYELYLLII